MIKKIKAVYKNEGLAGVSKRVKMKVNEYKKMSIKGLANNLSGKIVRIKEGKYSLKHAYPKRFFIDNLNDSRPMAEYLSPKLVKLLNIKSVIDFGCATGHWINALQKTGIKVLGIEGGENAKDMLVCDPNLVVFADLREPLNNIAGEFDMVMSIEVAEHIEHKFVDKYIDNMMRFNPRLIMMTAATPGQGGEFHVNEQESEYWDNLFLKKGYRRVSKIESLISKLTEEAKNETNPPEIMRNPDVKHTGVFIPFWMPKNLLIYSKNPEEFNNL